MFALKLAMLVLYLVHSCKTASYMTGSVYIKDGKASFLDGELDREGAVAYGIYNDTINTSTGWGVLDVKAGYGQQVASNRDIMYAAGVLEGAFTANRILQHYNNIYSAMLRNKPTDFLPKLQTFFSRQEEWTRDMVAKDAGQTALWRHVGYIMSQFDGLLTGCQLVHTDKPITKFMLQVLNYVGDLLDISYVLDPRLRPDFDRMSDREFTRFGRTHGHCSALIKMTSGYENIYLSHSSWFLYAAMLRVYKHYDFNLDDGDTAATAVSFSSYPGFLESLDDFYIMSSGLVMIQTTNNVYNQSLYDTVIPESLPAWVRVRVANHMASTAPEWGQVLKQYNSGTYNNQYMVVDLAKIKLNETIMDDALWVVEQIPTLVENHDQTNILRNGHWPSYNVPFYESVFNLSGYPDVVRRRGLDNSYMLAPRAKIFRRDADRVDSLQSMKNIMRYNDYEHDVYSAGDPCKTICCRGDLEPEQDLSGCYDTKVTDYYMALHRASLAVSGPTTANKLQPFSWARHQDVQHDGMAETFDFDFVSMKPLVL